MDKLGFNEETGLYNNDIKTYFLNEKRREGVSEYAIVSYLSTFKKAADAEKILNKDLGDFNRLEFGDLLISYSAKSNKSIISIFSNLKNYNEWLSAEGYLEGRIPITTFFTRRDLDKYVFTPKDRFISWDEILNIEIVNYQDAAIPYLLYDGIKGEKNCEIINMKGEHLDYEHNIINIVDENDKLIRRVKVHKETMDVVREAFLQKEYYKSKKIKELNINLESEEVILKSVVYELPSSPYVMRRGIKEASNDPDKKDYPTDYDGMRPISGTTINARVKKIAKEINKYYLNTTTVHQSGMLYRLKEIEDIKGFLTTADYAEVLVNAGGNEANAHSLKILYLTSFNPDSSDSIKLFKKKR